MSRKIVSIGKDTTFEEDLTQDVLEIITAFSARLDGGRSCNNQKLLDTVKKPWRSPPHVNGTQVQAKQRAGELFYSRSRDGAFCL